LQLINHIYSNLDTLHKFIEDTDAFKNAQSVLIQLFYSKQELKAVYEVRDAVHTFLPEASLIATSTAGTIDGSSLDDAKIVLSFSLFENSSVNVICFKEKSHTNILQTLQSSFITPKSKLLIMFANTYTFDSQTMLQALQNSFEELTVAGGNSGDDFIFEGGNVFTAESRECDVAFAVIDSDSLHVESNYLFHWQPIGKEMRVTKASGDIVYELNGKSVLEKYRKYLGEDIVANILKYGIEFPLLFEQDGVQVARAAVAVDTKEGALRFTGEIPEGCLVRFGYANIDTIEQQNTQTLQKLQSGYDGAYIYTCAARRQVLGEFLSEEIDSLASRMPCSGFVSYAEFFHNQKTKKNNLLNITTTYVLLREGSMVAKQELAKQKLKHRHEDIRLKALTHLISTTSKELEENVHYLEQFKKSVEEASIFSITNKQGIILEVNENFEKISGYSKEELLGKAHNIVRHEDTPKDVFEEMWSTIRSGKIWNGLVKNKRKDGRPYYVISEVSPIYNKDGSFREYIGIRNDVTELEEYKNLLRHELDSTSQNLEESLFYTSQYEDAINSITAVLKTDTNNKITYANKRFCELSGYTKEELIGRECSEMRHRKHRDSKLCQQIAGKLANGERVKHVLTNIAKDSKEYITHTLFYPMKHRDGTIIEYVQIMHDITEIFTLNEEITNTQKEVVLTMGAIGETRSQETGLHVRRVAEYSYLFAKLAGLSENEANLLKQASPMHDIGKVGIPDSILNKPAKLTDEEFEVMKTHASIGYDMLKHSKRPILQASAQVALTHHEKYNGTGYPRGLKAENIPIFGRITAIADVFDALGHDRCYKKAWELEKILELFRSESGKHFDPNLIALFFDNLDKFLEIRDSLKD